MTSNSSIKTEPFCEPFRLLDLGTGSGCIAISLAHELEKLAVKQWQITAIDQSSAALEVAKRNAQLNKVKDIEFLQSDWFTALEHKSDVAGGYHVIVSNPPYIDPDDQHLDKLSAEPLSALVAGNNGLSDIERIISGAVDHLISGGLLAIEHGYDQGEVVRQLFACAGFENVQTIQDYGGNDRVTMGELEMANER